MAKRTLQAVACNDIERFAELKPSSRMIDYVAQRVTQVARPNMRSYISIQDQEVAIPSVLSFVTHVIRRSRIRVSVLLTSLVYLDRARLCLPRNKADTVFTAHSIFLAALVVAEKYINDHCFWNKHWSRYSPMPNGFGFSISDITCMETRFLRLLNWDLRISLKELNLQFVPLVRVEIPQYGRLQPWITSWRCNIEHEPIDCLRSTDCGKNDDNELHVTRR
jgi:hypothetical protein